MKLSTGICMFALGAVDARPLNKQIGHLRKASQQIFEQYFINPTPDATNPAHANGWLTNENRRSRRAGNLQARYAGLNDIIDGAYNNGCFASEETRSRFSIRFVDGDFKKAITQVTKNYLKVWALVDSEKIDRQSDSFNRDCKKAHRRMGRKIERFNAVSRRSYCERVADEDWCENNPVYNLPEKVQNKQK